MTQEERNKINLRLSQMAQARMVPFTEDNAGAYLDALNAEPFSRVLAALEFFETHPGKARNGFPTAPDIRAECTRLANADPEPYLGPNFAARGIIVGARAKAILEAIFDECRRRGISYPWDSLKAQRKLDAQIARELGLLQREPGEEG